MGSVVATNSKEGLPSFDLEKIGSRPALLNIARDYIDHADEHRNLAKSYQSIVKDAFEFAARSVGAVLIGAVVFAFTWPVHTISLGVTAIMTITSIAIIQLITIGFAFYNRRISLQCINKANLFESQAMIANAKAAELPAWNGKGALKKLWGLLMSDGNEITKMGSERIDGMKKSSNNNNYNYRNSNW